VNVVGSISGAQHDRAAADVQCADRALPATPTQPGKRECAPTAHVVAESDQGCRSFDAVFDDGVVERAAVDAGVGADLDVVADAPPRRAARSFPSGPVSARSRSRRRRSRRRCARCRARRCGRARRDTTRRRGCVCPSAAGADEALGAITGPSPITRGSITPARRSPRRADAAPVDRPRSMHARDGGRRVCAAHQRERAK
jgi:hypothetical protein